MQQTITHTYTIRRAEHGDIMALIPLLSQLIEDVQLTPEQLANALTETLANKGNHVFIIEQRSHILGTAQLMMYENLIRFPKKKAIIDSVIIDQSQRGTGIGTHLIDYMIRFAQSQGVMRINLVSSYKRYKAYAFYRSLGFVDSGLGFEFDC